MGTFKNSSSRDDKTSPNKLVLGDTMALLQEAEVEEEEEILVPRSPKAQHRPPNDDLDDILDAVSLEQELAEKKKKEALPRPKRKSKLKRKKKNKKHKFPPPPSQEYSPFPNGKKRAAEEQQPECINLMLDDEDFPAFPEENEEKKAALEKKKKKEFWKKKKKKKKKS